MALVRRLPHSLQSALLPCFVFTGALLLFTLQPMVGRTLLPAYGGGFHVWTTCLMFFQGVLLAGYTYAHLVAPRIGRWHLLFVALPLLALPIAIEPDLAGGATIASILAALAWGVALPVAVLSTTSVVAQTWLARARDGETRDPYWLYAASNAGSLLGLLAYPLLAEPLLGLGAQRFAWTALFVVYVGLALSVAPHATSTDRTDDEDRVTGDEPASVGPGDIAYWFTLSMGPSVMLMAVTNAISHDVGSIPLVWVAPLAIYLTTFIFIFRDRPWYPRVLRRYWPELALTGVFVLSGWLLFPNWPRIALHLLVLFAVCMCGHAELHRRRPAASRLTTFYLVMSAGGFAGGVFVSLVAPAAFSRLHEYAIAVFMVAAAVGIGRRTAIEEWLTAGEAKLERLVRTPLLGAAFGLSALWLLPGVAADDLFLLRNHYGVYKVGDKTRRIEHDGESRSVPAKYLVHNGTIHGLQVLAPELDREPTGYYHFSSPLGDALGLVDSPRKVAVIGLGAGGMAPYFGAGDEAVFYELDPDGERIARSHFSYLDDCEAEVRVVIGDARVELTADPLAPDGTYDAIVVDAFNGDAIPTHLLTREALAGYLTKLEDGGVLIFNITNRFYDLRGVLAATGRTLDLSSAYRFRADDEEIAELEIRSRWYVMTRNDETIEKLVDIGWQSADDASLPHASAWTDDYVNVLAPMLAELRAG